jgi:hypothetical protein
MSIPGAVRCSRMKSVKRLTISRDSNNPMIPNMVMGIANRAAAKYVIAFFYAFVR